MRAVTRTLNRPLNLIGSLAFVFALLLASPGVRVSQAEADYSYDSALESAPPVEASAFAKAVPFSTPGSACNANPARTVDANPLAAGRRAAGIDPTQGLQGMPLRMADGGAAEPGLNSLNGRGYNIGKADASADLQKLLFEVKHRTR